MDLELCIVDNPLSKFFKNYVRSDGFNISENLSLDRIQIHVLEKTPWIRKDIRQRFKPIVL